MSLQAAFSNGGIVQPMVLLQSAIEATDLFPALFPNAGDPGVKTFHFNAKGRPAGQETQDASADRPLILLTPDYPVGVAKTVVAASGWVQGSGSLQVVIEKNISDLQTTYPAETTTDEELLRVWDNLVDEFTNQIIAKSYELNLLDVSRIHSFVLGRSAAEERAGKGQWMGAQFKVDWGPGQQ